MTSRKTTALTLTALATAAVTAAATTTVWVKDRLRALTSFSG